MYTCKLLDIAPNALHACCRADATYSFDDSAGNQEQGSAKLFLQRVWGDLIAAASVTCLGQSLGPEGDTWVSNATLQSDHNFWRRTAIDAFLLLYCGFTLSMSAELFQYMCTFFIQHLPSSKGCSQFSFFWVLHHSYNVWCAPGCLGMYTARY